jgi:hypothetical protein
MPIVHVFLVLILIGVLLWVVTTYVPLAPPIRQIILAVGAILAVLFVLQAFGLFDGLSGVRVR